MNRILILLASLLIAGNVYALPQCPASGYFDNCFGTYTDAYGNKYVGEFKDNKSHGQGTVTYVNGNKHVGYYKDGMAHGQGTFTDADGAKYVGNYKDGKMHGHGTFTLVDGNKYVGEWKGGHMHGQGTLAYADERKYVGEFKESLPWQGIEYDKDGNITFKVKEGVKSELP